MNYNCHRQFLFSASWPENRPNGFLIWLDTLLRMVRHHFLFSIRKYLVLFMLFREPPGPMYLTRVKLYRHGNKLIELEITSWELLRCVQYRRRQPMIHNVFN